MTIETLKRIMWRMRTLANTNESRTKVNTKVLRKAIMIEAGTSEATFWNNKRSLKKIGWIESRNKHILLTGRDIVEDYLV